MKEIIRAPHSGFCFGVRQAIQTAMDVDNKSRTYSCGPLIHNRMVTDDLAEKGINVISSLCEAEEGSAVIVRSHGEGRAFYVQAEERKLKVIDATCPFVTRIHELVSQASSEGEYIVIVGDGSHPEVRGIKGWCTDRAVTLASEADVRSWISALTEHEISELSSDGIFMVAQTTILQETFDEVAQALASEGLDVKARNTICSATKERQDGCRDTAEISDAMVVIGDKNSSNTRKLAEISQKHCRNTFFIENIEDLPLKEMQKYNRIGVAAGASTPENAIKEVITIMSDNITDNNLSMEDFMEDIEKSLRLPRSGELVTGTVHSVSDKEIIVNLGCKKDGVIPLDEITIEGDAKLTDLFHEGDEIDAKVLKTDDGDGTILLSRKKLEASEHWKEINQAYEDKSLIEVEVVKQVNGGVIAVYKEVSGFIPLSQLSDRFVEDSSEFVGQTLTVKVSRVDERRGKAVFSHKAYLNEEHQKALKEVWEKISVDDIVEGTVMRFTDYGAFVDIGGIDGLLHISEISWGKLKHPQEVLSIGQKITVKVLSMNEEKGKISLGLKQTVPEPWSVIDDNYHVGDIVKGKVVQIKEYGCFVELEPGLDGLVHISEVRHRRVANINDEISQGEEVNAKILDIDKDRRRISLSIKATLDPEEEAAADAARAAAEEAPAEEAAPAEEVPAEEAAPTEEDK